MSRPSRCVGPVSDIRAAQGFAQAHEFLGAPPAPNIYPNKERGAERSGDSLLFDGGPTRQAPLVRGSTVEGLMHGIPAGWRLRRARDSAIMARGGLINRCGQRLRPREALLFTT